ncbi:unnamed protein product [Schistocephalus solidus]|uniref:Uncharacterized protein n=1 Tax=Schistocephalus solidus TaxID=70667 RepID=A0A183TS85_SCHSO|nr:unnamed protein product [Schistocephalus solidus]
MAPRSRAYLAMHVRKRGPYSSTKYLRSVIINRIKKLRAIKLELHELDNRLKMELLGLNELAGRTDECIQPEASGEKFHRVHLHREIDERDDNERQPSTELEAIMFGLQKLGHQPHLETGTADRPSLPTGEKVASSTNFQTATEMEQDVTTKQTFSNSVSAFVAHLSDLLVNNDLTSLISSVDLDAFT